MTDDGFTGHLQNAILAAAQAQQEAEEQALLSDLGAPIFAQLMMDLQMNPLGIEVHRLEGDELMNYAGDMVLRIESKVSWIFTRPLPKPIV